MRLKVPHLVKVRQINESGSSEHLPLLAGSDFRPRERPGPQLPACGLWQSRLSPGPGTWRGGLTRNPSATGQLPLVGGPGGSFTLSLPLPAADNSRMKALTWVVKRPCGKIQNRIWEPETRVSSVPRLGQRSWVSRRRSRKQQPFSIQMESESISHWTYSQTVSIIDAPTFTGLVLSDQGLSTPQRLQSAGSEISISRVLRKLPETMFILYMLIMGVSAFTIQPEEHPGAAENCQFRGKYFKTDFRVEGEPVVLRCPQVQPWLWTSVSPHTSLAWRKNDSARMVPGKEETRMWVQDGALWILPALQEDSGTYICTARNASYCDEMSVELRVFEKTEASLPFISYPQILTLSTSGFLVCPDLSEFTHNKMDMKIQWYKDSVLLDQDNEKFLNVKGTSRLLIHNVSVEDAGYYSCAVTFTHEGMLYNVSRNIELRVNKKEEETIPVIISPHQTILASLGSRLTIPCKVFLGAGTQSTTMLWWMANNTKIENAYQGGRVAQGQRQEYSENNENYIEVPLIFDPVIREDLNTDFKCFVRNTLSFQMLHATVKEAASFSWGMVLAPLSLVILVLVGIIWMHRRCKHRSGKAYSRTMFKTGH